MAEAASGGPSAGDGAGPSSMLTWKMLFGSAMAGEMSAMRYIIEIIALQGLIASPSETLAVIRQPPTVRCLRLKVGEMPAGGCRYIRLHLGRRHAAAGFGEEQEQDLEPMSIGTAIPVTCISVSGYGARLSPHESNERPRMEFNDEDGVHWRWEACAAHPTSTWQTGKGGGGDGMICPC